jgi:hypothetical protein
MEDSLEVATMVELLGLVLLVVVVLSVDQAVVLALKPHKPLSGLTLAVSEAKAMVLLSAERSVYMAAAEVEVIAVLEKHLLRASMVVVVRVLLLLPILAVVAVALPVLPLALTA